MGYGLDGRVAIVTGAARGIGLAIAQRYAREGVAVMVSDIDEAAAAEAADLIRSHGARAASNHCDVRDEEAVRALFDATNQELGAIDIVVSNAGYGYASRIVDTTVEQWDDLFAVNVRGVFLCVRQAARHMQPRGRGCIINIASAAGKQGRAYTTAYGATKHAVIGITRCAAHELAPRGIRVNALCPGLVETRFWEGLNPQLTALDGDTATSAWERTLRRIPLGRHQRPDDVANAAVMLASDDASYITGQSLSVDGGLVMQ